MKNLYSHPLHEVYDELDDQSNDLTGISELLLTIAEDILCLRDRPTERDYHAELSFLSRQIEKMGADLRTTTMKKGKRWDSDYKLYFRSP